MANNFLGLPFDSWVKKQIDTRQEALGQNSNIDEKFLRFYTTKTPFLRLASSINLTNNPLLAMFELHVLLVCLLKIY